MKMMWTIAALIWAIGGFIRMIGGDDLQSWGLCLGLALLSLLCGEILTDKEKK